MAYRSRISLPLQLRGQWRNCTALPGTSGASRLLIKDSQTRSVMTRTNENALDLRERSRASKLVAYLFRSLLPCSARPTVLICFDATCSFPERTWSLYVGSRQGFLTSGSNAFASRPSQSLTRPVTFVWKLGIAGTQWREPSGHLTQLPLSPSWVPATFQFGF